MDGTQYVGNAHRPQRKHMRMENARVHNLIKAQVRMQVNQGESSYNVKRSTVNAVSSNGPGVSPHTSKYTCGIC